MVSDLLAAAAVDLADGLRRREFSPLEVVDAHIARAEAVNPLLNALVAERFEAARAEARQAESRLMAARDGDALPPLLGVPCTIKEFLAVTGMPLTAGIVSRRDVRAETDAEIVRRVRAAGAIVLGVSNIPEGGLWMETDNRIYGRTNNPWNPARTAGGSTGGEGALIAAGASPFGIGADVGGSIRIPAAFCGIVGHKPTGRMVPNTGYWPPVHGDLSAYLVCGPMARRVRDLMPLLRVLAGPDGVDTVVRSWPLADPATIDLREVSVFAVESPGRPRIRPVVQQAVRDATAALVDAGARRGTLRTDGLQRGFEIWSAMMSSAPGPSYGMVLGDDGNELSVMRELWRLPLRRSAHTTPAVVMVALERLAKRFPGGAEKLVAIGRRLQADLEAELGDRGVLIYPPYTRPAPRHRGPYLTPFDPACTAIFNVLELPSTVVPVGVDADGMPLAVQVVGKRGRDDLTIAVAGALEAAFGGWRRAEPRAA